MDVHSALAKVELGRSVRGRLVELRVFFRTFFSLDFAIWDGQVGLMGCISDTYNGVGYTNCYSAEAGIVASSILRQWGNVEPCIGIRTLLISQPPRLGDA